MGQPQTMSTFKTDNSSGPDDLVPSRYAVRVGAIDVLVISDGVLEPPAESMATNADPATRRPGTRGSTVHSWRMTHSIGR